MTIVLTIGSNRYIYTRDGSSYSLSLFTVNKPAQIIKSLKIKNPLTNKVITMDFKIITLPSSKMLPYLINWYPPDCFKVILFK